MNARLMQEIQFCFIIHKKLVGTICMIVFNKIDCDHHVSCECAHAFTSQTKRLAHWDVYFLEILI